ncbi:MAG: amidohydrolase family protein [Syntrophorhabdaceae bacterium]|nr:amidohydrolase family protein [Syntrophorhabdaceae bacterium]
MELFDTHTHVFPTEVIKDRERISQRDKRFAVIYGNPGARMTDINGLLAYMNKEGITRCVACGFSFQDEGLLRLSNDYILEAASRAPSLVPFVQASLENERNAVDELERCFALGARGVGEIALYERSLDSKSLRRLEGIARYAEEKQKILMLHANEQVGHVYGGKVRADLGQIVQFIEKHRSMDIILSHLGGGLCFFELMPEVRESLGRTYYDIAAIPFVYSADIYRFIEEFLWEKVFFGSDYPLLAAARYRAGISRMEQGKQDGIWFGNAKRVFGDV